MTKRAATALVLAPVLAAACGPTVGGPVESFGSAVRTTAYQSLAAQVSEAGETASLPGTGRASYAGYMLFTGEGALDGAVAEAGLSVDFGTLEVSGGFGDLGHPDGGVSGTGTFDGAVSGGRIAATVDGLIVIDGSSHALSGSLDAGFLGGAADFAAGSLDGMLSGGGEAGVVSAQLALAR